MLLKNNGLDFVGGSQLKLLHSKRSIDMVKLIDGQLAARVY
jgi:hypothetical protein